MAIARATWSGGPAAAAALLTSGKADAVEIAAPPLEQLPYQGFVGALLSRQGFKLDFRGQRPADALAMVADRLIGPGSFVQERALLAAEIERLAAFAAAMVRGARPGVSIRTYFAPGDLVWHLDRVGEAAAFRLLWAIGRPAGMWVTPAAGIDADIHRAFMHREHALLGRLDTAVAASGADFRTLWAHRPKQVRAMIEGDFSFLKSRAGQRQVAAGAVSIHRVATPQQSGTYHRSDWANHARAGLQIVVTAAGDPL